MHGRQTTGVVWCDSVLVKCYKARVKMPCESCAVQFSVFKRKRACCECERLYCSACLRRGGGSMCAPCRALSTRPLSRQSIAHLKVRDLQCFLQRQNISTRGCVEKEELVNLCLTLVNSSSYRRRGSRSGPGTFSTLKGLTNNINEFINSAFDLRQSPQPAPAPPSRSCYNTAHTHVNPRNNAQPTAPLRPPRERFTTTPGGEVDIRVEVPAPGAAVSRSASADSTHVDTADCFEIEDLDDSGWELVNRPADPLPNDSTVLLSTPDNPSSPQGPSDRSSPGVESDGGTASPGLRRTALHPELTRNQRAASELELRRPDPDRNTDTSSMHDEPLTSSGQKDNGADTPKHISLEQFKSSSDLEPLSVKQLKELLTRNRVEYKGCLERTELLERAKTLWRNHAQFGDEADGLPLEESCKICMAAPLECVLLECGHIAACTGCARQLAECPICRQYVVRAVRFFRA